MPEYVPIRWGDKQYPRKVRVAALVGRGIGLALVGALYLATLCAGAVVAGVAARLLVPCFRLGWGLL